MRILSYRGCSLLIGDDVDARACDVNSKFLSLSLSFLATYILRSVRFLILFVFKPFYIEKICVLMCSQYCR